MSTEHYETLLEVKYCHHAEWIRMKPQSCQTIELHATFHAVGQDRSEYIFPDIINIANKGFRNSFRNPTSNIMNNPLIYSSYVLTKCDPTDKMINNTTTFTIFLWMKLWTFLLYITKMVSRFQSETEENVSGLILVVLLRMGIFLPSNLYSWCWLKYPQIPMSNSLLYAR